jgi:hypothetical protein
VAQIHEKVVAKIYWRLRRYQNGRMTFYGAIKIDPVLNPLHPDLCLNGPLGKSDVSTRV